MLSTASASSRRGWWSVAGVLWLALFSLSSLSPVQAAEPPTVMVVFDGSGSMWAKLRSDRQPKLALARAAIGKVLPSLPPQTRMGLVSYGHRRQGTCSDVELLRAPATLDAGAFADVLESLNPKGRGPVTAGLREAVQALPGGEVPSAIVLIHDDVDNCQQNPCSLVEEIRKSHPRLVVHVVSIDLKPEENSAMLCLPRATGGRHFPVRTAEEIDSAIATALKTAAGPISVSATPVAPQSAARPAPGHSPPTVPGLHLEARLPVTDWTRVVPIRWRIEPTQKGAIRTVTFADGPTARVVLPDGRYTVELRAGLVTARQDVDVKQSESVRLALPGDASAIEIGLPAGRNWTALSEALLKIRPVGASGGSRPTYLGEGADRVVPVSPGRYLVNLQRGAYREEHEVTVPAGARSRVELAAALGEIEMIAVASDGGRGVEDVLYVVTEDDPQAPQGRREVARSAAARPVLALPAGTYQVTVRHGEAEVRERIAVRPGETLRRVIVLGSGQLKLEASVLPPEGADRIVRWDIVPVGGDGSARPILLRGAEPAAEVALSAGRYRISARFGRQNASADREIVVRAGGSETIALAPAAARVRLLVEDARPVEGREGRPAGGEVFWTLRNAAGEVVWRTSELEPSLWLQEGAYLVRAETKGRAAEARFAVRAGGDGTVTVAMP